MLLHLGNLTDAMWVWKTWPFHSKAIVGCHRLPNSIPEDESRAFMVRMFALLSCMNIPGCKVHEHTGWILVKCVRFWDYLDSNHVKETRRWYSTRITPPFSRDIWLLACEYQVWTRQHQELLSRCSNMIRTLVPLGIPVLPTPNFTLPYSTHPSLPQNVSTFILNSASPQTKSTPLTTFTRP